MFIYPIFIQYFHTIYLQNTKGSDVFEPEEENEFEETEVENNGKIVLNISGPDGGYVVNITSFAVCIPEISK